MRYALCIGGLFLAAAVLSAPKAEAQFSYSGEGDCNKGLFWPFVRNPGDCLTDAERRSGMTGTYRGSEVEEPGGSAEAQGAAPTPAAGPAQARQSAPPSAAAPTQQSSEPNPPQNVAAPAQSAPAPGTPAPAAPAAGTAAVQPAAAQSAEPVAESAVEEPAAEDDRTTYTGEGGCTKGIFWPFVRRAGDCLTDAEVRSGMTGTYR